MTRQEALDKKFCLHCAAYGKKGWMCGAFRNIKFDYERGVDCALPANVVQQFKEDHGLDGEIVRHPKGAFGDQDLMKKPRARRNSRISSWVPTGREAR